ncbi:hypothetical protein J1P26_08960 [Neobacillus sp. MM2021_6]|uniref:hypothetical protein n=1 Tax=Bacillaceae TaxID=186817 RepID=UPI00140D260C|nr:MULTISPECIES: hypothetical protein [Bacillaceae]MBO0959853.1 hypothetical protein [Neobacillus sp. MM2021_6]NHC20499.1 hypothetical protein [Bacillus sp. MM2020_4]
MNTRVERTCLQRRRRNTKIRFFTSIAGILLFSICSVVVPSIPGTFAWFTSETKATGTIQNATTADLLTIQASEVTYEENCSLGNAVSIKNISDLDTTVRVSVTTTNGEMVLREQHVNPHETLVTNPADLTKIIGNECKANQIEYRIHAFTNFVDEPFVVSVDPTKMKQMIPPPSVGSDMKDVTKDQEEDVSQDDQQQNSEGIPTP